MHRSGILLTAFASTAFCFFPIGGMAFAQGTRTEPTGPPTNPGVPGAQGPATPSTLPDSTMPNNPGPTKVDDKKFLKDAAMGGMLEMELGKLATQKGSSDEVKQFGQKMLDDHTKASDGLKQVAAKENVNIPDSLDSRHQSRVDKLAKLSGPQFDKAYMKDQLKDHEQDVRDFQNESRNGSDPEVKQFASKTLPLLQEHLEIAKNVAKTAKNEGK
jgi:putative membrane protein